MMIFEELSDETKVAGFGRIKRACLRMDSPMGKIKLNE